MKYFSIILFCIYSFQLTAQELNESGHIINPDFEKEYVIQNKESHQFIVHRENLYPGNAFIQLAKGFATIENTCGNTPPTIRIYDINGNLKATRQYNQTINPSSDLSKRYLYFKSNDKTIILDSESLTEQLIPSTHDIAVTTAGKPIYFTLENNQLFTPSSQFQLPFIPYSIELSDRGIVSVFGKYQYALIKDNQISLKAYQNGSFFESKTINGNVLWVEKAADHKTFYFKLNQYVGDQVVTLRKQSFNRVEHSKNISHIRTDGTQILCPMYPDSINYPFRIGNSYAEHQKYGGQPYLHPGVDLLGMPFQEIYTPVEGVVKAIITTSGSYHWRLALGQEDTDEEQDGYLFAHLDPSTIPFAVGDSVSAGDFIGVIVEWPSYDFHHLHFARIQHHGEIWDGNWLTKDNVLSDILNFKDDSSPEFETLWNEQTIAFRSEYGEILAPDNLFGSFDIICHAHDLSNDVWRLDVDSLGFEVIDLNTNEVVYIQESFSYDFILDTYDDNVGTSMILNTIYSTDNEWKTIGNYNERQFYQQVSRSNGDGVIDENDNSEYFDSTLIPNGSYRIRIHAYNAVQNHNFTEIEVIIDNAATGLLDLNSEISLIYPNPNSGHFKLMSGSSPISKIMIYNNQGQLVQLIDTTENNQEIHLDKNGLYFLSAFDDTNQLLIQEKVFVQK